jgi:hypothetical protein
MLKQCYYILSSDELIQYTKESQEQSAILRVLEGIERFEVLQSGLYHSVTFINDAERNFRIRTLTFPRDTTVERPVTSVTITNSAHASSTGPFQNVEPPLTNRMTDEGFNYQLSAGLVSGMAERGRSARSFNINTEGEAPVSAGKKSSFIRLSPLWAKYNKLTAFTKTVKEIYEKKGFQKTVLEDIIGVEFENELPSGVEAPWHEHFSCQSDNSLRNNGVEWVLKRPDSIKVVQSHCIELLKKLKKANVNNTERASTHVHFDVTLMNYQQLIIFSCCYFFVEELLSKFAGESRQNNLFCLRLVDSKRIVFDLLSELQEGTPFHSSLFSDSFRYSALNFSAVSKFGSLEFRLFPAVSEPDLLNIWINTLNNIRLFSLKFATLEELDAFFVKESASKVILDMLGKEETKGILKQLKKDTFDKEVLMWSRNSYCTIAPILSSNVVIPAAEEILAAKIAAEKDEERLQKEHAEKMKTKNKEKPPFIYPYISQPDPDQTRQFAERSINLVSDSFNDE